MLLFHAVFLTFALSNCNGNLEIVKLQIGQVHRRLIETVSSLREKKKNEHRLAYFFY